MKMREEARIDRYVMIPAAIGLLKINPNIPKMKPTPVNPAAMGWRIMKPVRTWK